MHMLRAHYAPTAASAGAEAAAAASPRQNEHYTDCALLRREALRFAPTVVAMLQRLWRLARPLGGDARGARFDEARYVRMWCALQQQLQAHEGGGDDAAVPSRAVDRVALEADARREFAVDAQGAIALDAPAFSLAMFARLA